MKSESCPGIGTESPHRLQFPWEREAQPGGGEKKRKNVNFSSSFDLESKRTFFGGNLLAHIFDELKYVLSMHWMSSRGSERITEQESGQDLLESKREESL